MALIRTLISASIRNNRASFVGLFLLMLLCSITLCFTIGMYLDLHARMYTALEEVGAGDAFATDPQSLLTDEAIEDIKAIPEVGSVQAFDALLATISNDEKEIERQQNIEAWGDGLAFNVFNDAGTGFVENPSAPNPGEAYVPLSFPVSFGPTIGDTIEVAIGNQKYPLRITRYIEDPQMGSPFMEQYRILVAPETFDELYEKAEAYLEENSRDALDGTSATTLANAVQGVTVVSGVTTLPIVEANIFISDEAIGFTPTDLSTAIYEQTDWGKVTSGLHRSTTVVGYAMIVVIIATAILSVFALLLFAIALVICTHNITSSIEENYPDYGTFKAIGVPNRSLAVVLVGEYAGISLVGLLGGFCIAQALLPLALPFFAVLTGVLATPGFPLIQLACICMLLLVVIGVALTRARRLGVITPLGAFRSDRGDPSFKSSVSKRISGTVLGAQLALRAIISAKRRYVGLFACACLLCTFIVVVLGLCTSLYEPDSVYRAFGIWTSDLSVAETAESESGLDFSEVAGTIEEVTAIEESWSEGIGLVNSHGESSPLAGLSAPSLLSGIVEGREPKYDNEILIGTKFAAEQNLQVGDEVSLPGEQGMRSFVVSGILSTMFNAGYGKIVTFDSFRTNYPEAAKGFENSRQYTLTDPSKADEVKTLLHERFGNAVSTEDTGMFSNIGSIVNLVQSLFISMGFCMAVIAALLIFLAVSMIVGRMFTAERQNLGVYKALGFTASQLRRQFALKFLIVSLLGCTAGAILAGLGGSWLISQMFSVMGVTSFALEDNPVLAVGSILGLSALFLLAAYFSSRKIKRIEPRELIVE